jgi:hypothetical protein
MTPDVGSDKIGRGRLLPRSSLRREAPPRSSSAARSVRFAEGTKSEAPPTPTKLGSKGFFAGPRRGKPLIPISGKSSRKKRRSSTKRKAGASTGRRFGDLGADVAKQDAAAEKAKKSGAALDAMLIGEGVKMVEET